MKYLEQLCKKCGRAEVRPPTKAQLEHQPVLVQCDHCGRFSRYGVTHHNDGTTGYTLYKWGNGDGEAIYKVRRGLAERHLKLTSRQIRDALDKVYGL